MRQIMSKSYGAFSRFANKQSPVIKPVLLGWCSVYYIFFMWLFAASKNKGYMITNAMCKR